MIFEISMQAMTHQQYDKVDSLGDLDFHIFAVIFANTAITLKQYMVFNPNNIDFF